MDEWHERRATRAAECKKELNEKLNESFRLANELWMVAEIPQDQKEARAMQQLIHGLRLLLETK